MQQVMRQKSGYWPHFLALGYALGGFALGLWLITRAPGWPTLPGMLLLAHAMVIGAYLVHECAHNTIFLNNRYNAWLGELLDWLVGSAYGSYEGIRHKHFRHHVDRADVVAFDYRPMLERHPVLLRLVQALEWAYIPAVDLLMHSLVLILPFRLESRRSRRGRVIAVLFTRILFFAWLGWVSPWALLWYGVAYMLFLHVMRFMDVHQHTYEVFETLEGERGVEAEQFDRSYENHNTYSNLISLKHPWMNLFTLNFGYHNAHHVRPTAPWYALPRLHREQFGDDRSQILFVSNLLRSYHRYRVARVLNADPANMDVGNGRDFIGVVGVSFLTAH
ncbi:MAG: fatty acid desaturase [Gammaproteobacteria bacterium]